MGKWPLSIALAIPLGFAPHFVKADAPSPAAPSEAAPAATAPTAATQLPSDIVIWYRASEGCPSGAEFVSGIRVNGRNTRLARVGDRVDYVITLESDGKVSGGRLERQTASGTIAISELRGGPCSEVADALALSLMLAVTPSEPAATQPVPSPPAANPVRPRGPEAEVSPQPDAANADTRAAPVVASASPRDPRAAPTPPRSTSSPLPRWRLGGGVEVALGMTPDPSYGGNLFVEYDWALISAERPASVRVGPGFMVSRSPIDGFGHVDQWVTTLGLEFCPLMFSAGTLGFAPCAVGEGGWFVASSSRDTSTTSVNFWGAAGPALRGRARLSPRLQLGLSAAVAVPFSRLELTAGGELLYRTPPAVFSLAADLAWAIQ